MAKLPKLSEIDKKTKVVDFWLDKSGLTIQYEFDGKELTLIATPEQTCDIFKKHGWIEEFTGAGDDVAVEVEYCYDSADHEGNHCQKEGTAQMHWDDFWTYFTLSQLDALRIVIRIESDKAFESILDKTDIGKAIDNCIKKINGGK